MVTATEDEKQTLHRYLQAQREAVVWKLDGLDERAVRWPATPSGTNLLGLVKHLAWVELGYFGECFDRPWSEPWPWEAPGIDDHTDLWASAEESREAVVDLYRRAWVHTDETVAAHVLTDTGRVPWWPQDRREPTLHTLLVHVIAETARHAGHADIVREEHDGRIGMREDNSNLPDLSPDQWQQHVERLRRVAAGFGAGPAAGQR